MTLTLLTFLVKTIMSHDTLVNIEINMMRCGRGQHACHIHLFGLRLVSDGSFCVTQLINPHHTMILTRGNYDNIKQINLNTL